MQLYLNTIKDNSRQVEIILKEQGKIIAQRQAKAERAQAEVLLPLIEEVLRSAGKNKNQIKEIIVENKGGTFTSLRIGVVTANALAFALDCQVKGTASDAIDQDGLKIVEPIYEGEPNIVLKR
jgi:tRNA threonylcarbamoyladenosine biosynthesis protein TsaB